MVGADKGNGTSKPVGLAPSLGASFAGRPSAPAIYQLKIAIAEIVPAIWRRVQVRADTTLAELHEVIQPAFGWWNYHLHQFIVDGHHFGIPDPEYADELPPMRDEEGARIHDIADAEKIVYEYDFGDSWEHIVEIESITMVSEPGAVYPTCTAGARARPPEDCGGTSGYERMLEILADRNHEEYREMRTWVGRKYDPEKFDVAAINRALRKLRRGRRVRGRAGEAHP